MGAFAGGKRRSTSRRRLLIWLSRCGGGFRSQQHHGGSCKINFAPFERFPAGPTRLDGRFLSNPQASWLRVASPVLENRSVQGCCVKPPEGRLRLYSREHCANIGGEDLWGHVYS